MELKINNKWISHGNIFSAEKHCNWAVSHSSLPTVLRLNAQRYRVYFSARNNHKRSHLGYFEFNPANPNLILSVSEEPALTPGRLGAFDCDGVYGTSVIEVGQQIYCYYGGWTSGQNGLFYSSIGLAISSDGGYHFERIQEYPILSRDKYDHWAVLAPFVQKTGDEWRMWYVSGIDIDNSEPALKSSYHLQFARSHNGIKWAKTGKTAIGLDDTDTNISRTWINQMGGQYHAWYSYVKSGQSQYQLGYATSSTGLRFERCDGSISMQGYLNDWAGNAIAYPCVFFEGNKAYMLYNGELNGRTGIGIASCDIIQN